MSRKGLFDVDTFLGVLFVLNTSYVFLATLQRRYTKSYPARRHRSDAFSFAVVVVHMLCALLVVYGGACWFTIQRCQGSLAARTLAGAAFGHSATNVFLLRKVPGVRWINVPLYVLSTGYNTHFAARLITVTSTPGTESIRHRELLLLWCGVSTYIWVRYFIFTFFLLAGFDKAGDERVYSTVYTLALPSAGVMGMVLPRAALGGDDDRWWTVAVAFPAVVAVLAMVMISLHPVLISCSDRPNRGNWSRSVVLQFLIDTLNPHEYHGREFGAYNRGEGCNRI